MKLKNKIDIQIKESMLNKNKSRLIALRAIKSAILLSEKSGEKADLDEIKLLMKNTSPFNLDQCSLSNDLWPDFINKIGFIKANLAVRQSLDLQRMQGSTSTLPVLILETCGTALVNSDAVKTYIGLSYLEQGMVLIFSSKLNAIQLLRDN